MQVQTHAFWTGERSRHGSACNKCHPCIGELATCAHLKTTLLPSQIRPKNIWCTLIKRYVYWWRQESQSDWRSVTNTVEALTIWGAWLCLVSCKWYRNHCKSTNYNNTWRIFPNYSYFSDTVEAAENLCLASAVGSASQQENEERRTLSLCVGCLRTGDGEYVERDTNDTATSWTTATGWRVHLGDRYMRHPGWVCTAIRATRNDVESNRRLVLLTMWRRDAIRCHT